MTANSPAERAERADAVRQARHSNNMDGLTVSPETLADADEYTKGIIDVDELVQRTRQRHHIA